MLDYDTATMDLENYLLTKVLGISEQEIASMWDAEVGDALNTIVLQTNRAPRYDVDDEGNLTYEFVYEAKLNDVPVPTMVFSPPLFSTKSKRMGVTQYARTMETITTRSGFQDSDIDISFADANEIMKLFRSLRRKPIKTSETTSDVHSD